MEEITPSVEVFAESEEGAKLVMETLPVPEPVYPTNLQTTKGDGTDE